MNSISEQIMTDIDWLMDECGMNDEQCDEIIQACEGLGGISAEYFCEEFVFVCEDDDGDDDLDALNRIHDDNYLNIAHFNSLWWSQ